MYGKEDPFIAAFRKAPAVRGSIFTQHQGRHQNGRLLISVVGVLGVDDETRFKDHHQYYVGSGILPATLNVDLEGLDHGDKYRGWGLGNMLTQPIWRI